MFQRLFIIVLIVLIVLVASAFYTVVDVFAMEVNGVEYKDPFASVCFDPLLSNVVLLNSCKGIEAAREKQAEIAIVEPVTIEPEIAENPIVENPVTIEPESECKNKNSGKDNTPTECNAGHGQEKNGG